MKSKCYTFVAYEFEQSMFEAQAYQREHGGDVLEIINPLGGAYVFAVGRFENA